ncbi:helix-turn-helix domain-containing protein [Halocatena halophila]|uniref:helix-turn-helix domain-containing protein n=1 Tax=Halocatena halophila TaxID=2814576 RepID=UPI002ED4FB64
MTALRYITIILRPEASVRSQADGQLRRDPQDLREIRFDGERIAKQVAIQYLNRLTDGTVVGVARFRGDCRRLAEIEAECSRIISSAVTGGESWLAFVQYEPTALEASVLELLDGEPVSINWPIEETADGLRVTFVGEESALQGLIEGFSDAIVPVLERTGTYQPETVAGTLTTRQHEILDTAIAAGYYAIPRQTTQRELATELGISRSTVGDHLRRAEAKIIRSVDL